MAIMLASLIPHDTTRQHSCHGNTITAITTDRGALSVLSLKDNNLGTKEAGKVLGKMLKVNLVLKELDLSDNNPGGGGGDPVGFAQELALGITDNGALTTLIFGGDTYISGYEKNVTPVPATLEVGMTEADFSYKNLGSGGAIIVAAWISHKDNGAMTKLDMSKNYFAGAAAGKVIGDMLTSNSTLKGLDLSGCRIDSGAAKGISKGLAGNGALTSLDISNQRDRWRNGGIGAEGAKYLAEALKDHA
jgi:hypothetical protein